MSELIEIRCPLTVTTKSGRELVCNRLCVKVQVGSSGEAYCSRHDQAFEFDVEGKKSVFGIISREKPERATEIATPEHPTN